MHCSLFLHSNSFAPESLGSLRICRPLLPQTSPIFEFCSQRTADQRQGLRLRKARFPDGKAAVRAPDFPRFCRAILWVLATGSKDKWGHEPQGHTEDHTALYASSRAGPQPLSSTPILKSFFRLLTSFTIHHFHLDLLSPMFVLCLFLHQHPCSLPAPSLKARGQS